MPYPILDPTGTIGANELVSGFERATELAAVACVAGGVLSFFTISSRRLSAAPPPEPGTEREPAVAAPAIRVLEPTFHCGLDATPLVAEC